MVNKNTNKLPSYLPKMVLAIIFVISAVVTTSAVLYLIADMNYQKLKKIEPMGEMTNWNVYKNEKYGFEIKYPNTLSALNINNTEPASKEKIQQRIDFNIDDKSKISILVWDKDVTKNKNKEYEKIIINKKTALRDKKYPLRNYIYHKSYICQIEYFGIQEKEKVDLYNNMLSTLKFID